MVDKIARALKILFGIAIIGSILWIIIGDYMKEWDRSHDCKNGICQKKPGQYVAED